VWKLELQSLGHANLLNEADKMESKARVSGIALVAVLVAAGGLAMLGGCTAMPTVEYRRVQSSKDMQGMADAYFLQRSKIEISINEVTEGAKDGKAASTVPTMTFRSVPAEDLGRKLAVNPVNNWRAKTTLALTKFENTDLVSAAGVEATNEVINSINEFGAIIVKAAPLLTLFGAAEESVRPCLDPKGTLLAVLPELKDPSGKAETLVFQGNASKPEKDCVNVSVGALPPDAISFEALTVNENVDVLYYAACRPISISVTHRGEVLKATGRISDPRFVQSVRFPAKGTLNMHSQCGVSIKSDKASNETTASAIIEALAAQAKAIKEVVEAAKK
jgi:hypothetical protein